MSHFLPTAATLIIIVLLNVIVRVSGVQSRERLF